LFVPVCKPRRKAAATWIREKPDREPCFAEVMSQDRHTFSIFLQRSYHKILHIFLQYLFIFHYNCIDMRILES